MDAEDSVVQTSDQEELEELAATDLDYWRNATREIARRRGDVSIPAEKRDASLIASSPRRSQRFGPHSPSRDGPPAKRRKVRGMTSHMGWCVLTTCSLKQAYRIHRTLPRLPFYRPRTCRVRSRLPLPLHPSDQSIYSHKVRQVPQMSY